MNPGPVTLKVRPEAFHLACHRFWTSPTRCGPPAYADARRNKGCRLRTEIWIGGHQLGEAAVACECAQPSRRKTLTVVREHRCHTV